MLTKEIQKEHAKAKERGCCICYCADSFQARASGGRRGAIPIFLSSSPLLPFLSDLTLTVTTTSPLHPPPPPPLPEPRISQGALNSLALFDLGRSGVSVRYKPMVNHE